MPMARPVKEFSGGAPGLWQVFTHHVSQCEGEKETRPQTRAEEAIDFHRGAAFADEEKTATSAAAMPASRLGASSRERTVPESHIGRRESTRASVTCGIEVPAGDVPGGVNHDHDHCAKCASGGMTPGVSSE